MSNDLSSNDLSGQLLKGYELQERLGEGAFGEVYRATQSTLNREVAIKIIVPRHANQPEFIRRFEVEAQLVAKLEHHHIVPLHDYWRDPNGAYLVMRWLKGGSLYNYLKNNGGLSIEEAVIMIDQIAQALHTAHRNKVIHRDIKPGNILLDEDGNAFVADFGIAKDHMVGGSAVTDPENIVGTPDYLSPEQARSEPVTPQTDIYSLGVVLYEMLEGKHPFPNLSPIERLFKHLNEPLPDVESPEDDIRDALNDVIQKATAKDPMQRFKDMMEFAQAVKEAAQISESQVGLSLVELLTPREQEVLQMIIDGKSNREIADELVLTLATVKSHVNRLYKKLNVRSRVQAIVKARELDLIVGKTTDGVKSVSWSSLPEPKNPYKGLQAFQASDEQDYFGRDKLIGKLLTRLQENVPFNRFLAIVGPSGSGKSSVVKAGLVPSLWRGEMPDSEKWYTIDMIPGTHPLDELEVALLRIADNQSVNLREHLQRDERGLVRAANLVLPDDGRELLIVIDQFEEVFTLVENEADRKHFLGLLRSVVADDRSRVRIVVTLRADYYDRPLQYPEFGDMLRNRVETVLPLSADELEQAIKHPAENVGVKFENGLVSKIVSDVHYQPGALPLLQYALTELFERRDGRTLTLEAYTDIGGTGGALAKRADEIFMEGNDGGQALVKQIFLRLVTLGEGAEDTRRRVDRSELLEITDDPELMDEIIDIYAQSRLLSLDHDPTTRKPTVEVAHEAILREWERLREWLNNSRDDIKMERQIAHEAELWQEHNRDKSYLRTGSKLEQAEKWQSTTELALTPLVTEFIQTSTKEANAQELAEKARQTREATQEKRSRTLLRALVAVFALATIIAGGLAFTANDQRIRAEDSEEEALRQASIGIAALAENEASKANTERAILLAIEALEHYPYTPQAQSALAESIDTFLPVQTLTAVSYHDWVEAAAWSPDGQYVAASGVPLVIWDVESGDEIFSFGTREDFDPCGEPHQPISVPIVSWSPSGEILATVVNHFDPVNQYTCGIMLWDITTGVRQLIIGNDDQSNPILSVDWSPDGNTILTASGDPWSGNPEDEDHIVTLWDAQTGVELQVFTEHTDAIWDVKFSPDGKQFATASVDGTVRIWNVESASSVKLLGGHVGSVQAIAWSPDGNHLVSGGDDGLPRIWDIKSGEVELVLPGHTDGVILVDWSADGTRIASQSLDGTTRLWDATTGRLVLEIPNAGNPIFSYKGFAEFSPDSNQLLTTDTHLIDGQVYVWDITSPVPLLFGHTNGGDYASWSPDGQLIVTSSYDGTMRIWNSTTGEPTIIRNDLGERFGRWGDWSPDNSRVVIPYGALTIFDTETGETLAALPQDRFGYFGTDWSPDGSLIVTSTAGADPEQQTFIIDADSYEIVTTLQAGDSCVEGWPHFSPDSTKIATGCQFVEPGTNAPARIWDAKTGEELMSLESEHGWSYRTLWSPDGTRLLVTYEHGVARIWNTETYEVEMTYSGHLGLVWSAAWSPDGTLVATSDQTTKHVNIWDSTTGEEVISYAVPSNINTISWSPDGEYVMFFGDSINEPIIKPVWTSTEELIDHANECCVTRELANEERQQFGLPIR